MDDFVIETAERKAIPVMIGLYGLSGSGKTLSGLKLARGLVGASGKIGVIDTENGRAQLYAGREEIGSYHVIGMTEPFAPGRFTEAAIALENAGCDVIVIDSISAEWEGPGGVLDMADKVGGSGLQKWNKPKMAHRGMVQRLIRSSSHIIFCCRGKEEVIQEGKGQKATITRGDVIAIQERDFIYEMTVHMRLNAGSNIPQVTKCIDELRPFIDPKKPLTVETGKRIAEWVNQGAEYDARARTLHAEAVIAAQGGVDAFTMHVSTLAEDDKALLRPRNKELTAIARSADASKPPPETDDEDEAERERIAREAFEVTDRMASGATDERTDRSAA